jgi:DNA-nicking Smr family endonuclease
MGTNDSSTDDANLFREEMKTVRPLKTEARVNLQSPHHENKILQQQRLSASIESAPVYDGLSDDIVHKTAPGESVAVIKAGLQQQQFKKLKNGQISLEATIDLHGYRIEEARAALTVFLRRSQNRGLKCVRVVHGKGSHRVDADITIKSAVANWLTQLDNVMGFASCIPADGGTGAVYVLLKRSKIPADNAE